MRILCSPNTEDIESYIKAHHFTIKKRKLHLVPTMILYQRRFRFYSSIIKPLFSQDMLNSNGFSLEDALESIVELSEIDRYIKDQVYSDISISSSLLSTSEATVILERIIKDNPETNNVGWLSVLQDLITTFIDLSISGLEVDVLRGFDVSRKWQISMDLYDLYLQELKKQKFTDFGISSHVKLHNFDSSQYDELILDGAFLPINPKLQQIINSFLKEGKEITIFLPFNLKITDQPATKVLLDVYKSFLPVLEWESIRDVSRSSSFFIDQLPTYIFRDSPKVNLDNSLILLRFSTLEEELTYIMKQIHVLVKYKEISPAQVVIITPNAMELRPLVREISEQNNLKVRLPQRPFLHLAQGKAIKYLYDARTDQRKIKNDSYLNISMYKILISGSLLNCSPKLIDCFEIIESFFSDCLSFEDWKTVFIALQLTKTKLIIEKYPHHPINSISLLELAEMLSVLGDLELITKQLLNISPRTVKEHVKSFIDLIQNDKRFVTLEEPLWERLSIITKSLNAQERISITASEFGERISALFSEQEELELEQEVADDDNLVYLSKEILVTGPNNVEFQRYDYVFVCRFTQDVYPEPKKFDWLISKEIESKLLNSTTNFKLRSVKELELFYLDRSLYYIYLMFCAANTQLTISYSRIDNGVALTPSHYLHDVAKIFDLEEEDKLNNKKAASLEELLVKKRILKSPSNIKPKEQSSFDLTEHPKLLIKRRTYTVEEITINKYCPRRFYYQTNQPSDNIYTQLFHLQAYASSCLYEQSIELLVSSKSDAIHEMIDQRKQFNLLLEEIKDIRIAAEKTIRPLFPINHRVWNNVTSQTDFFLHSLIHWIFDNSYVKGLKNSGNNNMTVQLFLSSNQKEINIDGFVFTATKELEVQYNHGEIHRYSITNRKDILSFSSNELEEIDQMKEVKTWYDQFKRSFYTDDEFAKSELSKIINQVSAGEFNKNAGGHCKYCPFNKQCHEHEVDQ